VFAIYQVHVVEFLSRVYDKLFPRYSCFLIVGASGGENAWHWSQWQQIYPRIDELAAALGQRPSIRSRQIIRGRSAAAPLGRLSWSTEGHQRWCHHSPVTADRCSSWLFVDAEIFMPPRSSILKKRALPFPVAYLQLTGVGEDDEPAKRSYDQKLLLALLRPVAVENGDSAKAFLECVQAPMGALLTLTQTRRVVSLNQFESILLEDFTYRGMPEDPLPVLERTRGHWETWVQ
jgi:hypothetical protein